MARRISLSMPAVEPVLDDAESSLVDRSLEWLRAAAPHDSAVLWGQLKRVVQLGAALDQSPSLSVASDFAGVHRDESWFANHLSRQDPMLGELALPEKAVLARAFLATKLALLRGFLDALAPAAPGHQPSLWQAFRQELAQSIYTALATEILSDLLWDAGVGAATRQRAARQLILIWDRAIELEIDDFCPLLEAAWRARSRVAARYGALLGTSEYIGLLQADCPAQFLEFFCVEGSRPEERQAFEEFLFGLTYDELTRVRAAMQKESRSVVDTAFVAGVLDRPVEESGAMDDPDALFRSYRRRRTSAQFRRLTGASGPVRVAEAYLMICLLMR